MKNKYTVLIIKECGTYEKLDKDDLYKKLRIREVCLNQDNIDDMQKLNSIHDDM